MSEETSKVFRCTVCNKPFDKSTTLKRHGYYCRSRRTEIVPKARSCVHCIKAKSQCDRLQPTCSRCSIKGLPCSYPASVTKVKKAISRKNTNDDYDEPGIDPDHDHLLPAGESAAFPLSEQELASLARDLLSWNNPDSGHAGSNDIAVANDVISYTHALISDPSTVTPTSVTALSQANDLSYNIPSTPSNNIRSLTWYAGNRSGSPRIASMMLDTLRSYPMMMLIHGRLPPFIHPRTLEPTGCNDDLEPMHNCINLVQMIKGRHPGGRKLFWRNVRQECEEIRIKAAHLGPRAILAATQALAIYILIRMEEGETEHNNIDFLLRSTILVLFLQFARIVDDHRWEPQAPYDWSTGSEWDDWILEESKRRLCLICRVVEMLVYFEATALCTLQPDLMLAPLPSRKSLWEASDRPTWDYDRSRSSKLEMYGLAANGNLVEFDEDSPMCSGVYSYRPEPVSWQNWAAGMDGMGGLVMLTASMAA